MVPLPILMKPCCLAFLRTRAPCSDHIITNWNSFVPVHFHNKFLKITLFRCLLCCAYDLLVLTPLYCIRATHWLWSWQRIVVRGWCDLIVSCTLLTSPTDGKWVEYGRTEFIKDVTECTWATKIVVPSSIHEYRFLLFDVDGNTTLLLLERE